MDGTGSGGSTRPGWTCSAHQGPAQRVLQPGQQRDPLHPRRRVAIRFCPRPRRRRLAGRARQRPRHPRDAPAAASPNASTACPVQPLARTGGTGLGLAIVARAGPASCEPDIASEVGGQHVFLPPIASRDRLPRIPSSRACPGMSAADPHPPSATRRCSPIASPPTGFHFRLAQAHIRRRCRCWNGCATCAFPVPNLDEFFGIPRGSVRHAMELHAGGWTG